MDVLLAVLSVGALGLCVWGSILGCLTGQCCAPTQPGVVTVSSIGFAKTNQGPNSQTILGQS